MVEWNPVRDWKVDRHSSYVMAIEQNLTEMAAAATKAICGQRIKEPASQLTRRFVFSNRVGF
jgi:hypothetical protein